MTDSEEYRKHATLCADLAQATKSPDEREQWLRMQRSWLRLAEDAERRNPQPRDRGRAASAHESRARS
jgi:hypothetical protein